MGGYFGAEVNYNEIMWEIYRYGPVVASVMADDDFDNGKDIG